MFKAISILAVLISSVTLASCQNNQHNNVIVKKEVESALNVNNVGRDGALINRKKPCKASSPPIKDKNIIKKMLINSGKITVEMSAVQVDKVVRDYIQKKQGAFKRCNK